MPPLERGAADAGGLQIIHRSRFGARTQVPDAPGDPQNIFGENGFKTNGTIIFNSAHEQKDYQILFDEVANQKGQKSGYKNLAGGSVWKNIYLTKNSYQYQRKDV